MKRLYVLRHSKAGQTNKKIMDDHERALTDKGIELCPLIGEYFSGFSPTPELVLCSSATRAKETADLVLKHLDSKPRIEFSSNLYLATLNGLFSILQNVDDSVSSLLVVGHNPGLQQFSMSLAGTGDKKLYRQMKNNFPPPSLVVFNIEKGWKSVGPKAAQLVDYIDGKSLKKQQAA